MKTMHLFAGAGGGILADLILGHEPVVAVEWEPYACQVLRERVADGWFPGMHVWEGDVRLFDPSEYKGRVDCIHAGFPCQDISTAGNQYGIGEGTRSGLYREVLRCADEVRPEIIFMENVAAILSVRQRIALIAVEKIRRQSLFSSEGEGKVARFIRSIIEIGEQAALGIVLGDLASRGFDAVWCCLSAAEVGAKHKRDRWWMLAYPNSERKHAGYREVQETHGEIPERNDCTKPDHTSCEPENVADTKCVRQSRQGQRIDTCNQAQDREGKAGDAVDVRFGQERKAKSDLGLLVDDVADQLDANAWNEVEPIGLGRVTNETENRAARLKALGNGQVPLQAAVAFSILWQMMEAANESA